MRVRLGGVNGHQEPAPGLVRPAISHECTRLGGHVADEATDRPRPTARFELSDLLPDGVNEAPMERDGEFVWLIRRGLMAPELIDEMNKRLEHIVGNGLWQQKWDGPCPPPHSADGA